MKNFIKLVVELSLMVKFISDGSVDLYGRASDYNEIITVAKQFGERSIDGLAKILLGKGIEQLTDRDINKKFGERSRVAKIRSYLVNPVTDY